MSNKALVLLSGMALSVGLVCVSPAAANADDGNKRLGGVLRCGGISFLRQGGGEAQYTNWDLRNLSSTTPVTVERVTFFAASGAVLFDSGDSGLPPFLAGVYLGPTNTNVNPPVLANNVLGPNQTTGLTSFHVPGVGFVVDQPMQVEFVWSAPARVPPLDIRTIRIARERILVNTVFVLGADRSRGDFNCISIG
jgi:hypothetical protein